MTTNGYHEPVSELSASTRSLHRALATVIEELEAVDWYQQRADVATDEELRAIMIHNRDEELEHAAMGLEWLRRRVPKMDEMLRTYLFTEQPIVAIEEGSRGDNKPTSGGLPEDDLGIGALDTGE
ncbi:MAG: ferritin [Planctomycetaceae bacterium]|nr:MAG: ferritin [Planctomycetaceae bacterium]